VCRNFSRFPVPRKKKHPGRFSKKYEKSSLAGIGRSSLETHSLPNNDFENSRKSCVSFA
jgi:hypothetical protein